MALRLNRASSERAPVTKKQAIWFLAIGVVAVAVLVAAHLVLPIHGSWTLNRVLHYVWEGATGAAVIGGVVWLMWPRPKARRRDHQREQARRRFIALVASVLAAVILVVFAEIHREMASRSRLSGQAVEDIQAIGRAIEAYAADHDGKRPESPADLVPKYLPAERLYYLYRTGPDEADPPADPTGEGAEEPSYALVKQPPPRPDARETRLTEPRLRAYLRPGHAWAPLTVVLTKDGRTRVAGEDEVRAFEKDDEDE